MRIFNRIDAERDVTTFFALGQHEVGTQLLYERWLKQVWLKHLFKTDPGWVWPVQVQRLPAFFEDDSNDKANLEVDLPRFGKLSLKDTTEWDEKDARAGTLVYYRPVHQTMVQYVPLLTPLRDYLKSEVFAGKDVDYDVRKHAYTQVEAASARWHAEQAERLRRAAEERAARLLKGIQDTSEPPRMNYDWNALRVVRLAETDYLLVRLMTPKALDFESERMHHCVYSYKEPLYDGRTVLLSMRKVNDTSAPIVTIELAVYRNLSDSTLIHKDIVQVQGPCNDSADKFIPGVVREMRSIIEGVDVKELGPIPRPNGDQTFEVKL